MSRLYEGMFLIDNDAVRANWAQAKSAVSDLIEKHGGTVHTSRRWDERRLAYPIRHRNRATYLLTYYELPQASIAPFQRDLEISETILRHLMLRTEEVPAKEKELTEGESASDFTVPEPPADDAVDEEPLLGQADDDEDGGDRMRRRPPADKEKTESPAGEGSESSDSDSSEKTEKKDAEPVAAGADAGGEKAPSEGQEG